MMKKLFVAVLFWNFYLQANVLFTETFDNEGTWPFGWTFDQYIDPETGEVYTSFGQNNWRVASDFQFEQGFTPPAAVFHYFPRIPLPNNVYIGSTHPNEAVNDPQSCLLYTSPSPRDS